MRIEIAPMVVTVWVLILTLVIHHLEKRVIALEAESPTVLVGTGCEGESSVAVAYEEDHLPVCAVIERHAIG